ncbi:MAG: UbiX family flavin prenyltransferase [Holophagaceae bacterium]|jgi:4-hydroxy-3-polyprenylbenzoate decarboxylase
MSQKYSLAMCGASGAAFGVAILKKLIQKDSISQIALMISATGKRCLHDEVDLGPDDLVALSPKVSLRSDQNVGADIASGSYRQDGMIIAPCSAGALGRIAWGVSNNLISRAADVCLKERKPLVICLRETPLNRVHLENMLRLHDAGAILMPLMPGFYSKPKDFEDLFDTFALRVLDQLGYSDHDPRRWQG